MKSLGIALTALNKRSDEVATRADAADKVVTELRDSVQRLSRNTSAGLSSADVENLQKRLAALEQAVRSTTGDKAARLALTAAAVRDAVVRGVPFTAELEEARSESPAGARQAGARQDGPAANPPNSSRLKELEERIGELARIDALRVADLTAAQWSVQELEAKLAEAERVTSSQLEQLRHELQAKSALLEQLRPTPLDA